MSLKPSTLLTFFRKKGVTTPEVESPMRVEDSPREPRKRKHENESNQPEQTVPKKKRLKTTIESEEKKASHHQRYKQVKLRINNNGQESYVALDDFKRKKAGLCTHSILFCWLFSNMDHHSKKHSFQDTQSRFTSGVLMVSLGPTGLARHI